MADELVLERKETVADGVVRLTLRHPKGEALQHWEPGAHVDLLLPNGLVRQYSLCGDPADRSVFTLAVLLEPNGRGGSRYLHEQLRAGDRVRIRGPRNNFGLVDAKRYLFIAGGIGITPILPMLAAVHPDWRLVYGGRTRASMAFAGDLCRRYGDRVRIRPQDETGLLPLETLLADADPDTAVYCCGPEPLLAAVEERCPPETLHLERFAPRPDAGPRDAFEVELARSGTTILVPQGRSILESVEDAGVTVLSSCREGTCGTCETAVLDGMPDHRDSLLTPAERETGDVMMICVSRARGGRLVLDL
jgi:ferredoxin-NADP reductase